MNAIYKSIWNESLQAYVPVSETKSGRIKNKKSARPFLRSISVFGLLSLISVDFSDAWACTVNASEQIVANGTGVSCTLTSPPPYSWSNNSNGIYARNGGAIAIEGLLTLNSTMSSGGVVDIGSVISTGVGSLITLDRIDLTRTLLGTVGSGTAIRANAGGSIVINGTGNIVNAFSTNINTTGYTGINSYGNNSNILFRGDLVLNFVGGSRDGGAFLSEMGVGNTLTIDGKLTVNTEGSMAIYANSSGTVNTQEIAVRVGLDDLDGDGTVRDLGNNLANAIYANQNGVINISHGSVASAMRNALYAVGNGRINVAGALDITNHLSGFSGAYATGDNAQINLGTSSTLTVRADNSYGLQVASRGKITSIGNVTINADEIENVRGGTVGLLAQNVYGAYALANSTINIGGLLTTNTTNIGAYATGAGARITAASANVTTDAMSGLRANAGGVVEVSGDATIVAAVDRSGAPGASLLDDRMRNLLATGSGSQVNVLGTLTSTTAGIGALAESAGKVTIGNANITVEEAVAPLTGATKGIALQATANSTMMLGTANLIVNVTDGMGINATGARSVIISTGSVRVTGAGAGTNVIGVKADAGGEVNLANVFTTDTNGVGALATGTGSSITLAEANITTDQVTGLKAEAGGVLQITGNANVVATADRGGAPGTSLLLDSMRNVWADGAGSQLSVLGTYTTTTAGIGALASNSGALTFGQANITVQSATPYVTPGIGVQATSQGQAVVSGVIDIAGQNGIGMQALNNGTAQFSAGTINVNAQDGVGVQANAAGTAIVNSGTINVAAQDAVGIQANAAGTSILTSGTININAANGIGAQASGANGQLVLNAGSINVNANDGIAVQAIDQGVVAMQNVNAAITLVGVDSIALNTKAGGVMNGTGAVNIASTAAGSRAVVAEANSTVDFTNVQLTTNTAGTGVMATGAGALVTLNAAEVTSTAGHGINASNTGVINLGQSIKATTNGNAGHAILSDAGGAITATGVLTAITSGNDAAGIYAKDSGSTIALNAGANVTTSGTGADALRVTDSGKLTGQNMILQTTGANASGIAVTRPLASSTPDLELSGQAIIKTTGAGADGIQIGGPSLAGYAKINGDLAIEVTGSGTASGGCDVGAGICVTGESSQFEALGAGIRTITSSANALRLANGNNLTLALENANLTTTAGLALIEGSQAVGTSHLDLSNSVAQAGSSNQLINITNNSRIALNSDKTQLIGDTLVDASSLLNLNLRNTSYLLGRIQGPTNLNLDSTSAWDVTANSVVGDISNAGKITFKHTETGPEGIFKSITANNYVGNDGWLNISTHLGNESSPSDKLIIDGGAATGKTTLNVTKYSGLGKPTRDKGIQVVEAKDGATTELTAFTLNGNVVPGGAYDYQLERNADASWYLVSREDLSDPESDDNLRPELSLYGGANALALLANANVIDTLHERKGGAQGWRGADPKAGPFWARVIRNEGQNRAKSSEDISGDDYDFDSTAIMAGMDVWSHQVAENIRSDAGVYVAYVDSKSHSTHYDGRQAGHNNLESTIVGAYWSNYFTNGMYVDVVGQYGYHRLKADSMRMLHLKTTGQSFALSVEVGMPFDISDAWIVEPQIQVRAQHGHLNNTDDSAGRVDFGAGKFLEGRLGVRAAYRTPETTFWTRFDVLREFQGESTTTVTAMSGKYAEETPSSLKGNSIALTLGVEKYLTKNTYMYASGDYKKRIGNEGSGHSYGLNLGVKFAW